eukprot:TRINITY_DN23074_c0_g1_i1.p1 TRINITY_DN23074_c0_g1~~TRINITY_DN23074_c0_g1_i1.p1  ORF type:complete len:1296 (-),score=285.45 TRINITY_DN23074_c0_g1_i1:260-4147(-)
MLGSGGPRQTLELITEAVSAQHATAELQTWGFRELRDRTGDGCPEEVRERIVELNGIELALQAMRAHPEDVNTQDSALALLAHLAREHAANSERIFAGDVVTLALAAMQSHADAGDMQGWACAALRNLAVQSDAVQEALVGAATVDLVLNALRLHVIVPRVQGCGCAVLGILATRSALVRASIFERGGVDLILAAMEHHPEVVKVQGCGWAALGNLICDRAETRGRFAELGGVGLVVDALRAHPKMGESVQVPGLGALRNLSLDCDHASIIMAHDGVERVASAMHGHVDLMDAQLLGMKVLKHLVDERVSHRSSNQEKILSCAGVELILKAAAAYPEDPAMQETTCETLRRLSDACDAGCERIDQLRGDAALLHGMLLFPASQRLQLSCCQALWSLCCRRAEVCARIVAHIQGAASVVAAMQQFPDDEAIQESASAALKFVSAGREEHRAEVVAQQAHDAMLAALKRHLAAEAVQVQVLEALVSLGRGGSGRGTGAAVRAYLAKNDGIAAVLDSMRLHHTVVAVQEACSIMLRRFSVDSLSNRRSIMELEGGARLLTCLQEHVGLSTTTSLACRALRTLALGTDGEFGSNSRDDHGAYQSLEEALERRRMALEDVDSPEVPELPLGNPYRKRKPGTPTRCDLVMNVAERDVPETETAVGGRRVFYFTPERWSREQHGTSIRASLVELGHLECVISVLKAHPDDGEVQSCGLLALVSLTFEDEDYRSRLVMADGMEVALKALELHLRGRVDVLEPASEVLRRACMDSKAYADSLVDIHGVEIVAKVLDEKFLEERLQGQLLRILQQCGEKCLSPPKEDDDEFLEAADGESLGSAGLDSVEEEIEIIDRLQRAGGIELTLKAMKQHRAALEVQSCGCFLVASFSRGNVDFRAQIDKLGGIPLALQAMREGPHERELQQAACDAMEVMATDFGCKAQRDTILSLDGIEPVLSAIRLHPVLEVRRPACMVLRGLFYDGDGVVARLFELGGIDLIADCMRCYPAHEELQLSCLHVLVRSNGENEDVRVRTVAVECIPLVIAAMKQFPDCAKVQELSSAVFYELCKDNAENRDTIGAQKGVELIAAGMDKHRKDKTIMEPACGALDQLLFRNKGNQERAIACNAMKPILLALQFNPKHEKVQERGVSTLWHLVNDSARATQQLGSQGGAPLVLTALKSFPEVLKLQYCGCAALAAICADNRERRDRLVMQKAMEVVVESLQKFLWHSVATAFICACLHSMIHESEEFAEQLFELEGFKLAGAAMKAHPTDEQVQLFAGMVYEALKPEDYDEDEDEEGEDED